MRTNDVNLLNEAYKLVLEKKQYNKETNKCTCTCKKCKAGKCTKCSDCKKCKCKCKCD